jgi:hypothetical protein
MFYFIKSNLKTFDISFLLLFQESPSLKTIPSPKIALIPEVMAYNLGYLFIASPDKNYLMWSVLTKKIKVLSKILPILMSTCE